MESAKNRPEKCHIENQTNTEVPLELKLLKTHALLARYYEDLAYNITLIPNDKLKDQLIDLVASIKPTFNPDAKITDIDKELFGNRPSWWDKLGIAALAFGVEHTYHSGSEAPTAYDLLMELSNSLTSVISEKSDHNRENIFSLCEALHKLDVTIENNHYSTYRTGF
jgi:hypothetical protein